MHPSALCDVLSRARSSKHVHVCVCQGSRLCLMCPENATNLEDGSDACPVAVQPGTNLTTRYAVIVSFGVFLNGTSLDDIAPKVRCPGP